MFALSTTSSTKTEVANVAVVLFIPINLSTVGGKLKFTILFSTACILL